MTTNVDFLFHARNKIKVIHEKKGMNYDTSVNQANLILTALFNKTVSGRNILSHQWL